MTNRCALFSSQGLGDGLIALVLAHNLQEQGYDTVFFHPFLSSLQRFFPKTLIRSFPPIEEFSSFDRFYFFYEKSPWMQPLLLHCETHFLERTFVLNPIATPNQDYPYWEVGQFDGTLSFVDNLAHFCSRHLQREASKKNGMLIPENARAHPKRVVLHPMSSRPGKNWPFEKYIALAKRLEQAGYEPVFILTPDEKQTLPPLSFFPAPDFSSLEDMVEFVSASGSMIGNDSGIGHLASCLGLPTVTLCRSRITAQFWRPGWAPGALVLPPSWLPNLKGLRLRDRYWKQTITVSRVFHTFHSVL